MNKKILAVSLVSFLALGSLPVLASQSVQTSEHSGYAVEENNKDGLDHDQVGGGDWWHGIDFGYVISNYQHRSCVHGSSVYAHDAGDDSGWCSPDTEARAKKLMSPLGGNETFWRTK